MVFNLEWGAAPPTAPSVPSGAPRGVDSLWVGALTSTGATVSVRLSGSGAARLACTSVGGTVRSSTVAIASGGAKVPITGLTPDTEYSYQVEVDAVAVGSAGRFRTLPTAGSPASFTIALGGDANSGSNHAVFDAIRLAQPLLLIHMGDMHYDNITSNNAAMYNSGYDTVFRQSRQAALYKDTPTAYVWDDHDYANDNSNASAAGHNAACSVYRQRVPHYPLADATVTAPINHSFEIGRVLFLVTDQRSAASPNSATDNSSKTMLGAAQKAWFKSQISAATGKLIVWVCPRLFASCPVAATADHWGGFSTERAELVDFIKANAHGRVVVLSADWHNLGIDNGTHSDFATGGGEPLRVFQCAPFDRIASGSSPGFTFSEGLFFQTGVYGLMAVTDAGGSIGVTWTGKTSANATLVTYSFSVSV